VEPGPTDPELPVYFHERRTVLTPMPGRLRVAGTLELTADEGAVDRRRVDGILAAASALRGFDPARARTVWRGLRPCTPDGLPLLGRTEAAENLVVAAGHGMWGLQLGPVTGRLVAQLITGERPEHDIAPLSPARFALTPRARRGARVLLES
jgi:D-amino-acid dehydrogenase